ncbi:hypothetical protein ACWEKT_06195 [Nocardia takedensis]|uniref:hypothetical protein n=1 Tax=Nocardia takedensis TaxID=259390 RepID=UPI000592656D|nr:hypothetical protein [Nocardia takedensis]
MAFIEIEELPAGSADVLRRRARIAGLSVTEYLRVELLARARVRVPDDAVVEFLRAQGRHCGCAWDAEAAGLVEIYDLPEEVVDRYGSRAVAAGLGLGQYIRRELIALARRTSVDDVMDEFADAARRDPSLRLDMGAIEASVRYARAEDVIGHGQLT